MKTKTQKEEITSEETLNKVVECLIKNIPIQTKNPFTQEDLYNIIISAASQMKSIENAANKLDKSYTGKTVRNYLGNNFQSFKELEDKINLVLPNLSCKTN